MQYLQTDNVDGFVGDLAFTEWDDPYASFVTSDPTELEVLNDPFSPPPAGEPLTFISTWGVDEDEIASCWMHLNADYSKEPLSNAGFHVVAGVGITTDTPDMGGWAFSGSLYVQLLVATGFPATPLDFANSATVVKTIGTWPIEVPMVYGGGSPLEDPINYSFELDITDASRIVGSDWANLYLTLNSTLLNIWDGETLTAAPRINLAYAWLMTPDPPPSSSISAASATGSAMGGSSVSGSIQAGAVTGSVIPDVDAFWGLFYAPAIRNPESWQAVSISPQRIENQNRMLYPDPIDGDSIGTARVIGISGVPLSMRLAVARLPIDITLPVR